MIYEAVCQFLKLRDVDSETPPPSVPQHDVRGGR